MEENENKLPSVPVSPTQQQQQSLAFAQAINNLNIRMNNIEIEIHKLNANENILKKTIELLEKNIAFLEKKIDNILK